MKVQIFKTVTSIPQPGYDLPVTKLIMIEEIECDYWQYDETLVEFKKKDSRTIAVFFIGINDNYYFKEILPFGSSS